MKHVGIIGGGVAGLTAAWELSRLGFQVDLFEEQNELGGLAAAFDFSGTRIERYYHFICRGDRTLIETCGRLGIGHRLRWRSTRTGLFFAGEQRDFGTPLDLVRFAPLSWGEKMRFGRHILRARRMRDWQELQHVPARDWLIGGAGRRVYELVWDPLLRIKFGHYHDRLPAAWMWHRIHRVASSRRTAFHREELGYLEGGTQTLIDAFAGQARAAGARIHLGSRATAIRAEGGRCRGLEVRTAGPATNGPAGARFLACDYVVSAVPLPVYRELIPRDDPEVLRGLDGIPFLGVVCMILRLRRSVSPYFWLNVNDERIAFNGVIEYTNLNRPAGAGETILYIPFYLTSDSPRFTRKDEELLEEYAAALAILDPGFTRDCIADHRVFRSRYAQPAFQVGANQQVPPQETPWDGCYLVESTQLYPADRIISGMLRLAQGAVARIAQREGVRLPPQVSVWHEGEIPA